jgi:hypothetical protein
MPTPPNKFDRAEVILRKYFQSLLKQMTDEVIEHQEDFESPSFSGQADCIVEKYSIRFNQFRVVYACLRPATSRGRLKRKDGDKPNN